MTNNENQYTIYIRSTKESIPVSKEEFDAYYHDINIYRIRQQRHGRCVYAAAQGNLQPQCLARTDRIQRTLLQTAEGKTDALHRCPHSDRSATKGILPSVESHRGKEAPLSGNAAVNGR